MLTCKCVVYRFDQLPTKQGFLHHLCKSHTDHALRPAGKNDDGYSQAHQCLALTGVPGKRSMIDHQAIIATGQSIESGQIFDQGHLATFGFEDEGQRTPKGRIPRRHEDFYVEEHVSPINPDSDLITAKHMTRFSHHHLAFNQV